MNKVTLPKEVAESLRYCKAEKIQPKEILRILTSDCGHLLYNTEMDALVRYGEQNFYHVLEALVNGYEAAKSPEEELLEYYRQIKDSEGPDVGVRDGILTGVEMTLNILGIDVKGITNTCC